MFSLIGPAKQQGGNLFEKERRVFGSVSNYLKELKLRNNGTRDG